MQRESSHTCCVYGTFSKGSSTTPKVFNTVSSRWFLCNPGRPLLAPAVNIAQPCVGCLGALRWPGVRSVRQAEQPSSVCLGLPGLTRWRRYRRQTAASLRLPLFAVWNAVTSLPRSAAAALPGCLLAPSVCPSLILLDCI